MSRNFLTFVVWTIIIVQRVFILQMAELWVNTFFTIILQILFVILIYHIRSSRKYDENNTIRYISLAIFYLIYTSLYIILMLPFLRANSFDLILVNSVILFVANYEIMMYRGYETYHIDWKKRLSIVLPLAIGIYAILALTRIYIANNPIIFNETVMYNESFFDIFRNIGDNYYLTLRFILLYTLYKIDFKICVIPRTPQLTDFWLKNNHVESYKKTENQL